MPQPSEPLAVAGIVLAAGASRRMGHNKMLVRLGNESVLHRAARQAVEAELSPVVVVLGHEIESALPQLDDLDCEVAFNPEYTGPTSSSLHTGIRSLPPQTDAAVVLLADMIYVSTEMVRALVERARATDAAIVASRYGAVTAPPLLFRRTLFPELLAWTGEGCAKAVLGRHPELAAYHDWHETLLMDIDTPEDLDRVRGSTRGPATPRFLRFFLPNR